MERPARTGGLLMAVAVGAATTFGGGGGGAAASPPGGSRRTDGPVVLVALGDSTVAGVGARAGSYVDRLYARLVKAGRGQKLINVSESGATAADVLRDQIPRAAAAARSGAGVFVVGVGVNDLTSNVSAEEFGRRFEAIVTALRARSRAPIVVSNLPDISLVPSVWAQVRPLVSARIDVYNAVLAQVARRHDLVLFDACAMTRENLPRHPDYISSDGFHPSDRGYEAWAEALWRVLERVL